MNSTFIPLWTKDANGIKPSGRLDADVASSDRDIQLF
jgi:hypothetical protein